MTTRFHRYTVSSTQLLDGLQPTFTLNLEVYCLTTLAVSEILRSGENPPLQRQPLHDCELAGPNRGSRVSRGVRRRTGFKFKPRSSIDVELVTDTTRTC
jgi:hypothetical protein